MHPGPHNELKARAPLNGEPARGGKVVEDLRQQGERAVFGLDAGPVIGGWTPRPARDAILDCARAILAERAADATPQPATA